MQNTKSNHSIAHLSCVVLALLVLAGVGCGDDQEGTIIGGPTAEILEMQEQNRREFARTMERRYGE